MRALSRERGKDIASDYADRETGEHAFAERRGTTVRERIVQAVGKVVPQKVRNIFEGLRLPMPEPQPDAEALAKANRRANRLAVERHARAIDAIFTARDKGRPIDPAMTAELNIARRQSNERREDGRMEDHRTTRRSMGEMAEGLRRDPQPELVLAIRKQDLGIKMDMGRSIGAQLAMEHGIDLRHGPALGR